MFMNFNLSYIFKLDKDSMQDYQPHDYDPLSKSEVITLECKATFTYATHKLSSLTGKHLYLIKKSITQMISSKMAEMAGTLI